MSFETFLAFNFMIKSFSKSLLLRIIIIIIIIITSETEKQYYNH